MNEERLKNLWKADQTVPTIDFARLQKLSNDWHDKLRRKVRIDVWVQSVSVGLTLIPVFFYPKMIFASLLGVILGIWYVRELRGLYKPETSEADYIAVKDSLNTKILTMKNYFRRTRIVMYVFSPLIFPAVFYGLNIFSDPSVTITDIMRSLAICIVSYEIGVIIATEIYFKIIYTPALNELKNLLRQLDFDE